MHLLFNSNLFKSSDWRVQVSWPLTCCCRRRSSFKKKPLWIHVQTQQAFPSFWPGNDPCVLVGIFGVGHRASCSCRQIVASRMTGMWSSPRKKALSGSVSPALSCMLQALCKIPSLGLSGNTEVCVESFVFSEFNKTSWKLFLMVWQKALVSPECLWPEYTERQQLPHWKPARLFQFEQRKSDKNFKGPLRNLPTND